MTEPPPPEPTAEAAARSQLAAARSQLAGEVAHWRDAIDLLGDLDAVASPAAWAGVEVYLRTRVRDRLRASVANLAADGAGVAAALAAGRALPEVRDRLLALRRRYLQVEAILDFYGNAVNTRTNPHLAAVLRGLDIVAGDSLGLILGRLGIDAPPALVYVGEGLGAQIRRADVRLWDQTSPSPAAAIMLTRHNLGHPTALLHETGHQVAHLTGWTPELAAALAEALTRRSTELAEVWPAWASEVAADVHAFAQAGWAPLPALANVVDGTTADVFRVLPGDAHPSPLVRVLFNVALCRRWFGPGPWDDLARAWLARHPPARARRDEAALARASVAALDTIVDVCTRRPMAAFGGRPLAAVADPRRVAPGALATLARQAGPSLVTSQYLARREPLRILAWLASRTAADPARAAQHRQALLTWLAGLGGETLARAA